MTAYIVGLIAGATCAVLPLLYLAHHNALLARQDPSMIADYAGQNWMLASSICLIGVVVLLVSTALIAIVSLKKLKADRGDKPSAELEPTGEEPIR